MSFALFSYQRLFGLRRDPTGRQAHEFNAVRTPVPISDRGAAVSDKRVQVNATTTGAKKN